MAKASRGTQVTPNTVVVRGDPQQMRRIRCPGCQGDALVRQDGSGKKVCTCTTCGRTFTSVPM